MIVTLAVTLAPSASRSFPHTIIRSAASHPKFVDMGFSVQRFKMPNQIRSSASWRVKRLMAGSHTDPRKKAHADHQRFRRAVDAIAGKANDIYVDGRDTRRERHVYVLVRSRRGDNFTYM